MAALGFEILATFDWEKMMTIPPEMPPPMMNYEPVPQGGNKDWMPITSVICGGVSLLISGLGICCCIIGAASVPVGIVGLVFGILGLKS